MELNAFPKSIEDTLSLQRKYIIPRFQREYHIYVESTKAFASEIKTITTKQYTPYVLIGQANQDGRQ